MCSLLVGAWLTKSKPWIDSEISKFIKELRTARDRYTYHRSPTNFQRLNKAREEASNAINLAKQKWMAKECEKINDVPGKQKWHIISKLTSGGGLPCVQPIEVGSKDAVEKVYAFQDEDIRHLLEEYHISKNLNCSSIDAQDQDILRIKDQAFRLEPFRTRAGVNVSASASLLSCEISMAEIDLSFPSSKGSPGSDGITPDLIDHADREAMSLCLHLLF